MRKQATGESRTALLVGLGAAVAVIVASGAYLIRAADPGLDDDSPANIALDANGQGAIGTPGGRPSRGPRTTAGTDPTEEGDPGDGGTVEDLMSRGPTGDSFFIDLASLKRCLERNEWEELRRQLVKMQDDGEVVPPEIVRSLMELLRSDEGRRLDAMLALGGVRDATTGGLLANLAMDSSAAMDARVAALDAIARNGSQAAYEQIRGLVSGAKDDTTLSRHAMYAVGGIGGTAAVNLLLGALADHSQDGLSDAIVTALAKSRDGDASISLAFREARTAGDVTRLDLLLRVGTQIGKESGPELRREVLSIVQSTAGLGALEKDAEAVERVRTSAIYIAGMMGGEALDAVIQLARSGATNERITAVNALRGARGDDAATKIAALVSRDADVFQRRTIAAALGTTESRVATPYLHAALDDPDGSVVETAANALGSIRDPASVPVILARLDAARSNFTVARLYVDALGQIGVNDALPKLRTLSESKDPAWEGMRPYIQRAIERIERRDPDSIRLATTK